MHKLTAMMAVLLAGASLAGCYSKSCDTACPGQKIDVVSKASTAKEEKPDTAPAAKTPPAADSAKPPVNDPAPAPASSDASNPN